MSTLVFDISGHGLGHVAQIASLIREIGSRPINAQITVRHNIDSRLVHDMLGMQFRECRAPEDITIVMSTPYEVNLDSSYEVYRSMHDSFDSAVRRDAERLETMGADLVVADVPYVSIAAAATLEIPAFALCSLHWQEVFDAYLGDRPGACVISSQIADSYNSARAFFVPRPRKSLPKIENQVPVGLMGRHWGLPFKNALRRHLGRARMERVALLSFGGTAATGAAPTMPSQRDWTWLVPESIMKEHALAERDDILPLSVLEDLDYLDIAASVDLVVTKTGYSTFAECMIYGVPCLFLSRPDWPESAEIEQYMIEGGYGLPLNMEELTSGCWWDKAEHLLANPRPPVEPTGHIEFADYICRCMGWA